MILRPKVEVYDGPDQLSRAAAERITAALEESVLRHPTAAFVLTGGNTPRPVYELLGSAPFRERLRWEQIHLFWGDERCVPPENAASNFGMAWRSLISRVSIPAENLHRIQGEIPDPEAAAWHYEEEIRRLFPAETLPSFDLILLGMGEDGHTASLFPGTSWDENRWVVANYVPKLDANRITMTPLLLNAARRIIFLTCGSEKAEALAGVLEDSAARYPAKRIQPQTGDLTWMIDKTAAALLTHNQS
jgi:6-phosphogluconolactonase